MNISNLNLFSTEVMILLAIVFVMTIWNLIHASYESNTGVLVRSWASVIILIVMCIAITYNWFTVHNQIKSAQQEAEKKKHNVVFKEQEYIKDKKLHYTSKDLKKCPRCGHIAEVNYSDEVGDTYYSAEGFAESFVTCTNPECGASTQIYSGLTPADAMLQAMLAWNNQVNILTIPDSYYDEEEDENDLSDPIETPSTENQG